MWIKAGLIGAVLAAPLAAQDGQAPMSAIDWLSKSVREKPVQVDPNPPSKDGATTTAISVTTLESISKDTVGLLPSSVSGLPHNFWGDSSAETISGLIAQQKTDSLPEILTLLYTVLLSEVDAPKSDHGGTVLLLARIDKLLDLGALDQAQALIERAGPTEAEIFRRWFDVSLLTGHEDRACTAMRAAPGFAPTLQARVFCLARNGDWNAAALTLATGESLDYISTPEADLMARFLDPELYDGEPDIPAPSPLTPLMFTMREAIAQPRPSGALPLAFVNADLSVSAGWRNQMAAAERLVRSQAIHPQRLIELYTERQAAASGGIWNRVVAIQELDVALLSGDLTAISATLPPAFSAMEQAALELAFAQTFGPRLANLSLTGEARDVAFKVVLLSADYESASQDAPAGIANTAFLQGLARGNVTGIAPPGVLGQAIAEAFSLPRPKGELNDLLDEGKLGEAILRAMIQLKDESFADPGDITAALATFRAVGLEQEARRTAIQLLLLERRG